jgi:hypothetical protein
LKRELGLKGRIHFDHGLSLQARVGERLRRMLSDLNPDLLDDANARRNPHDRHPIQ